jgi:hypothetical protein
MMRKHLDINKPSQTEVLNISNSGILLKITPCKKVV